MKKLLILSVSLVLAMPNLSAMDSNQEIYNKLMEEDLFYDSAAIEGMGDYVSILAQPLPKTQEQIKQEQERKQEQAKTQQLNNEKTRFDNEQIDTIERTIYDKDGIIATIKILNPRHFTNSFKSFKADHNSRYKTFRYIQSYLVPCLITIKNNDKINAPFFNNTQKLPYDNYKGLNTKKLLEILLEEEEYSNLENKTATEMLLEENRFSYNIFDHMSEKQQERCMLIILTMRNIKFLTKFKQRASQIQQKIQQEIEKQLNIKCLKKAEYRRIGIGEAISKLFWMDENEIVPLLKLIDKNSYNLYLE